MDARLFRSSLGVASVLLFLLSDPVGAQFGGRRQFTANSQNFIVFASSPQWAAQVAEMAELNRRDLAQHWLGHELPAWSERVPIHVEAGEHLGAGGETRFSLLGGNRIGQWMMSVSGTQERILDSVLPHEITHTIFATHFAPLGKYVPRWADEGACTTVEHISEKKKHQDHLKMFLQTHRGLAFNQMFQLKEYPADIMPLYAQGHSAVQFLIDQGGPQKFIQFLEVGMRSEAWNAALQEFYAYESIGQFQTLWNQWLADGSPENLLAYAPGLQPAGSSSEGSSVALASNVAGGSAAALPGKSNAADASVQLASSVASPANSAVLDRDPLALTAQPAEGKLSASMTAGSQSLAQSQLPQLGNESWYKRRLREVTGESSPAIQSAGGPVAGGPVASAPVASAQAASAPPSGLRPQAVGRSPAAQSAGIQVLDWGDSEPVPGIQPNLRMSAPVGGMVPLYR